MSTKKLIIGIILTIILFVFFIKYAFNGIQKVELTLDTWDIENTVSFDEELAFLEQYGNYEFVSGFTLDKLQIVLIDHMNEQAILWNDLNDRGNKQLKYDQITSNIKNANSFFVKLNKKQTVIMNCDNLLGDVRERIVVDAYKYLHLKQSKLNPEEIHYFQNVNEAVYERFLRNKMIDSLIEAIMNNTSLNTFNNYVYKWQSEVGDTYKSIAEYDMYEGSKELIKVKVKEKLDKNFVLSDYLNEKQDAYGFYMKEEEYRLIGMLMQLYIENDNRDVNQYANSQTDIYSQLLRNTPYISREIDKAEWELFQEKYNTYTEKYKKIVDRYTVDNLDGNITYKEIKSEIYNETIRVDENYYIYMDYKVRLNNNEVIIKDYVLVKVEPYNIEYYFNE